MYWRVKKISPEQLLRQYAVHLALIASVVFNLVLFAKGASKPALPQEIQEQFKNFARNVTSHLFDANYLTFEDSMTTLLKSEIRPNVKEYLKAMNPPLLPKSREEMKAQLQEMTETKSISCLKIDELELGPPDKAAGLVPADVKFEIATHTTQGVDGPHKLHVKYMIGVPTGTQQPALFGFQILGEESGSSGQQQQQQQPPG